MPRRRIDSAQQLIAGLFSFHRICADARCRRARTCCGARDREPCFAALWPRVSERDKLGVRALMSALGSGSTIAQALDASATMQARYDAAQLPSLESDAITPQTPTGHSGQTSSPSQAPRVRAL